VSDSSLEGERFKRAIADLRALIFDPSLVCSSLMEPEAAAELGLSPLTATRVITTERMGWGLRFAEPDYQRALKVALERQLSSFTGQRLGLYAERLLLAHLEALPEHRVLAHDLQLYTYTPHKRTLGALDVLVESPRGVEHWELAVKYFLRRAPSASWGAWLGPNERDTMAKKLKKMLGHQLPLSLTREAEEQLDALGLPRPESRALLCVGRLFEAASPSAGGVDELSARPLGYPLDYPSGAWARRSEWLEAQVRSAQERRWVVRAYPDWLHSDPELLMSLPRLTAGEVAAQQLERGKYLMLSELDAEGRERRRWFLLSDDWGRSV